MMQSIIARTVREFCRAYGVGHTKAYELIKNGQLRIAKVGTRTLIIEESARRWMAELEVTNSPLPITPPILDARIVTNGGEQRRKRQYHKSRKHRHLRTMANNSGG
jgi:excisionase family DNA binding protein